MSVILAQGMLEGERLMVINSFRRGQALMELAIGMFAIAMVTSALCGFAMLIAKSLTLQNSMRKEIGSNGGTSSKSDVVEIDGFASRYVFGSETLMFHKKVVMPTTIIPR